MEKETKWWVVFKMTPRFEKLCCAQHNCNQLKIKIQMFSFPKFLFYSRQQQIYIIPLPCAFSPIQSRSLHRNKDKDIYPFQDLKTYSESVQCSSRARKSN